MAVFYKFYFLEMLYFIGLGLGDEKDITLKGLEAIRSCKSIFLDAYTSVLGVDPDKLKDFYNVYGTESCSIPEWNVTEIRLADRETVESQADLILSDAFTNNVAFLVVGDPFGATTHTDLYLRAIRKNIPIQVIHNASILNAIGIAGLQLYNYGPTVSIPFFTENWKPTSFYDKIATNQKRGLHTLCLLDIKIREISEENLLRGKKIYEPPRYMMVKEAISQLREIEENNIKKKFQQEQEKEGERERERERDYTDFTKEREEIITGIATKDTLVIAMLRIGRKESSKDMGDGQVIMSGSMNELMALDSEAFGGPLHSLIIPAPRDKIHELEFEMIKHYAISGSFINKMTYGEFIYS